MSNPSSGVRVQVAAAAQSLHARGWVANHDGNVTARDGGGLWATPTATSKRLITTASLLEVDAKGAVVRGSGRVFGEIGLHLAVYALRADVNAVIHAHPPAATAIACSGRNLLAQPFLAEAVVSLGPTVPLIPFAMPGAEAVRALAQWPVSVDAVLLGNHGVLVWGADVEQALMRMELVEHLAQIALRAESLGGVIALPSTAAAPLLAARAKANLGAAATAASASQWPQSPASPVAAATSASDVSRVVQQIVRDEVIKALT